MRTATREPQSISGSRADTVPKPLLACMPRGIASDGCFRHSAYHAPGARPAREDQAVSYRQLRIVGMLCLVLGCGNQDDPSTDRSGAGSPTGTVDNTRQETTLQMPAGTPSHAASALGSSMGQAGNAALPATDVPGTDPATDGQDTGPSFTVPADSMVCGIDLPFQPPGCPCARDMPEKPCWTGPLDQRNTGDCKDGVQTCSDETEFATWGPCQGEVMDCGVQVPPDPPEPQDECPCVPGTAIGCDEDCEAFVICKPFSSKVCQPDGRFGPCRESLLATPDSQLLGIGCVNLFHGCFPQNPEGMYTGDCSKAFTCGHAPNGTGLLPF